MNLDETRLILRNSFHDDREFEQIIVDNTLVVQDYDKLFRTSDGEIICLTLQINDFDEQELALKSALAEKLYDYYNTRVNIYVLSSKNVKILVKECTIKSEADFTIKIACSTFDECKILLNLIKDKIMKHENLSYDEVNILSMLPLMCQPDEVNYYREEYFKIVKQLNLII